MAKEFVKYLNRDVPKEGFRVYIYGRDGKQMLVNSWDEFKLHVFSGEWFASKEEVSLLSQEIFSVDELRESQEIQEKQEAVEIDEEPPARKRGRPKVNN